MKQRVIKWASVVSGGTFLLAAFFIFSSCSAYDRVSKQAADKVAEIAVEQSEEVSAQPEHPKDADGIKSENFSPSPKKKTGPFAENPQGMDLYKAVLQDGATFYSTFNQKELTIKELTQSFSGGDTLGSSISEFTVVDLDDDSQMEVVLEITNSNAYPIGFEILHCQSGIVYGYSLSYRQFMNLKSDGSFYFSGGTANHGFGTIQFSTDAYSIIELARTASKLDESFNEIILYFVDGKEVSEDMYNSRLSSLCHTDAWWYSFTEDKINQIFA